MFFCPTIHLWLKRKKDGFIKRDILTLKLYIFGSCNTRKSSMYFTSRLLWASMRLNITHNIERKKSLQLPSYCETTRMSQSSMLAMVTSSLQDKIT